MLVTNPSQIHPRENEYVSLSISWIECYCTGSRSSLARDEALSVSTTGSLFQPLDWITEKTSVLIWRMGMEWSSDCDTGERERQRGREEEELHCIFASSPLFFLYLFIYSAALLDYSIVLIKGPDLYDFPHEAVSSLISTITNGWMDGFTDNDRCITDSCTAVFRSPERIHIFHILFY